ncbi:hypothetical protein LRB11_05190 [Ectothiorhodospira haloalkaliphila]|uniref:hypothetical protein n=1 Tax=Ectothiorhodospira haloalkaliphila TaxID=421628 RepID=UPI001EE80974|nr:hypothetical protein [Ectothiorhodospira haloalkaliphila]MCG5524325.1 hypothetical protein [Ectothiorhodospira haloalkaliphila]
MNSSIDGLVSEWQLKPRGILFRCWEDGVAVFNRSSGDVYVLSSVCGMLLMMMTPEVKPLRLCEGVAELLRQECLDAPQGEDWGRLLVESLESMERLQLIERVG